MKPVFIDTSFIVAIVNKSDELHETAGELALLYDEQPLITTNAIILETGNYFARQDKLHATEAIHNFLTSDELAVIYVDELLLREGLAMYAQYQDKTWGLVDCISFVVMRREGVTEALTADVHFEQAGFRALMRK